MRKKVDPRAQNISNSVLRDANEDENTSNAGLPIKNHPLLIVKLFFDDGEDLPTISTYEFVKSHEEDTWYKYEDNKKTERLVI